MENNENKELVVIVQENGLEETQGKFIVNRFSFFLKLVAKEKLEIVIGAAPPRRAFRICPQGVLKTV